MTVQQAYNLADSAMTLLSLHDEEEAELAREHAYLRSAARVFPALTVNAETALWLRHLEGRKEDETEEIARELAAR